jgi:hypothetical protein
MPPGLLAAVGTGNSVTTPEVILPILFPAYSVNQRLPSGPVVIPNGWLPAVGTRNSVGAPPSVRPILLPRASVNQTLPSGPGAIPTGPLKRVGTGVSVITPAVVMRPILLPLDSANQRLPSGPAAIPVAMLEAVGIGNSVMVWAETTPVRVPAVLAAITTVSRPRANRSMRTSARESGRPDPRLGVIPTCMLFLLDFGAPGGI